MNRKIFAEFLFIAFIAMVIIILVAIGVLLIDNGFELKTTGDRMLLYSSLILFMLSLWAYSSSRAIIYSIKEEQLETEESIEQIGK